MNILLFFAIGLSSIVSFGCATQDSGPPPPRANIAVSADAININTASVTELASLPGIGETLARRIVEFRERNGKFRRPEHLLMVPGISEKRFRQFRTMVRAE